MKKNIKLFTFTMLEHGGGHENSFMNMASRMADEKDVDVTVYTMSEKHSLLLGKLLNIYYLKKIDVAELKREELSTINRKLKKAKYVNCKTFKELRKSLSDADVVFAKNEILESLIIKFLVRKDNIKKLAYNCATCLVYPKPSTISAKIHNYLYTGFIYKFLANNVDLFIVKNSDEVTQYSKLFKKSSVILHYNYFDFNDDTNLVAKAKVSKLILTKNPNFLWVGRLTEQKGITELLELIKRANAQDFSMWNWYIAGDGDDISEINMLVANNQNVHYLGHVANDLVKELYSSVDIHISTSNWESFGNTLVESISKNTPVVARNIPGPRDIVINNINGKLVDSIDDYIRSINEILKSREKYSKISDTVVNKFSKKHELSLATILVD